MWSRTSRWRDRRPTLLLLGLLAPVLVGCPDDPVRPPSVATVEVSPAALALDVGQSGQLTATPLDADGNPLDRAVSWSTGDGAVATVDGSGEVMAVGAGSVTVTASCEGVTGSAEVDVSDPVVSVRVTPADTSLVIGDSARLRVLAVGASGDTLDRPVTWSSEDPGVATVDGQGRVAGVAEGVTGVIAAVEERSDTARVAVYEVLEVTTEALRAGTVDEPYADTVAAEGGDGEYAWSVVSDSLPAGLSLGSTGEISGTPTTAGSATFTVQAESGDGQTATAELSISVSLGLDRAYVAAYYELDAIDLATDSVVAEMDVKHGNALAVAPAGDRAYVASCMDDAVFVVDLAADTVAGTIPLTACHDIAFTPDGTRAFAAGGDVYAIDPASNSVIETIPSGGGSTGIAITPDGNRALLVNNHSDDVTVVELGPDTVVATVAVGDAPWYPVVSPDGTRAYVTNNGAGTVSVIDLATHTVTATIDLPGVYLSYVNPGPVHLAMAPGGGTVYVANRFDPSVSVIDTESAAVVSTIALDYAAGEVAVTPDGGRVYVAIQGTWEGYGYDVVVIDAGSNSVTDEIRIGWQPNAIAITPDH